MCACVPFESKKRQVTDYLEALELGLGRQKGQGHGSWTLRIELQESLHSQWDVALAVSPLDPGRKCTGSVTSASAERA